MPPRPNSLGMATSLTTTLPRQSQTPTDTTRPCPTVVMDGNPVCTIEEKKAKRELQRESQRQVWFQNKANELLGIPNGYEKGAVLIIRWDEELDEFKGHDEEIEKLIYLFEKRFNYHCTVVRLNTKKKPQNTLNRAIATHIDDHDGPNNLLLVYYTGHGMSLETKNGRQLELSATQSWPERKGHWPPVANWNIAEDPLRQSADGDALSILDCCFASRAAVKSTVEENRTYQLLAASAAESTTLGPGEMSFTKAFIDASEELLETDGTFPVTKLWEKINARRETDAALIWDRLGKYKRSLQLGPLDNKNARKRKNSDQNEPQAEKASLMLRFSLNVDDLKRREIESLAQHLNEAWKGTGIPMGCMDWVKMETSRQSLSFPMAVKVISAFKKRPSIDASSPESKRRRSYRSRSNPPTPESGEDPRSPAGQR